MVPRGRMLEKAGGRDGIPVHHAQLMLERSDLSVVLRRSRLMLRELTLVA